MDVQELEPIWRGIVVFFEPDYANHTLKEIGRTVEMDSFDALETYANTPNPASQLISYTSEQMRDELLAELENNIKDPEWVTQLFNTI